MAITGGSSATGLEILSKSKVFPRIVLVEANRASVIDSGFVDNLFHPLSFFLKSWLPALNTRYQPMNLIVNGVKSPKRPEDPLSPEAFQRLLDLQKQTEYAAPDIETLTANASRMAKSVDFLASKGVKIVFFRMPTHHDLRSSIFSLGHLNQLKGVFPESRFTWLAESTGYLPTNDGVHLLFQGAWKSRPCSGRIWKRASGNRRVRQRKGGGDAPAAASIRNRPSRSRPTSL